jgi:hypothetical protein
VFFNVDFGTQSDMYLTVTQQMQKGLNEALALYQFAFHFSGPWLGERLLKARLLSSS